ncbi:MAG: CPBP family glutamic-type intramembrane protease, partial [Candidatus Kariarchaeaceae archaeon]
FLIFLNTTLVATIFTELLYRRIAIPLLEDRGVSPLLAVILASLGNAFIDIPGLLISSAPLTSFVSVMGGKFLEGIFLGVTYILTRNILYSIALGFIIETWELLPKLFYDLAPLIAILVIFFFLLYFTLKPDLQDLTVKKWKSIIKRKSAPQMTRGIIGYFLISIGLLLVQYFTVVIYAQVITIVYFFIFLIPFWLIISTEYARN